MHLTMECPIHIYVPALDFLVSHDFICSTTSGSSRNQSYFLLYRPARAPPPVEEEDEEEEGVDGDVATTTTTAYAVPKKRRVVKKPASAATGEDSVTPASPKRARVSSHQQQHSRTFDRSPERPPSPPIIREDVNAGHVLGHLRMHHVAADATTCSVDNATRDRIVQHVSKAFSADEDCITVADLKSYIRQNDVELCEGSGAVALEEPHLDSILTYLADLNRIMIDGSGDDRTIYKI